MSDNIVFLVYLAGIALLGCAFGRRRASVRDFHMAGRSMGWFPIGLSVMVTAFSAVNFAAMPAEVFEHGLYVAVAFPVFILVAFPITRVFIPFYHGMRLTDAYDYLEKRFDASVRRLAVVLFLLWRLLWLAAALYASGKALSALSGWDARLLIALAGALATFYTAAGGMRAVMWTDVAQSLALIGGILAAVVFAVSRSPEGLRGVFDAAEAAGLLRPIAPFDPAFFSLDPRIRITFWSGCIGVFTAFLARYAADQTVVQMYFTARSLRAAQRGFWWNAAAAIFAVTMLALLGLAMHAFARGAGVLGRADWTPMRHMAFLIRSMPAGWTGLVAAAVMAATMSTVDAGIHACATAGLREFHPRSRRRVAAAAGEGTVSAESAEWSAGWSVGVIVALGALSIALALAQIRLMGPRATLFAMVNRVLHGMGAPLLALFLLGMFSRRANRRGALIGGIVGTAWSVAVSFGVERLALHYYAVVNLLGSLAAGYLASLAVGAFGFAATPEQLRWTWAARRGIAAD